MTTKIAAPAVLRGEQGIALVITLFLLLASSVVGAALMFMSQTETYSTMNYRMMSQARYGAESGVQKAANYLMYTYAKPAAGSADPMSSYVTTTSPVTYNGQPVVLSANSAVASNYPVASVQSAFAAAVAGSMAVGGTTVQYAPYATLLALEEVPAGQSATGSAYTIETWQVAADGRIAAGTRTAQVRVTAVLDEGKQAGNHSSYLYGLFAMSPNCGALRYSGNGHVDSYTVDPVTHLPVISHTNGNIGTNGNLTESGNATIYGTLSTPRIGVGSCSAGNVDALTSSGNAAVTGGVVHLPQPVTIPTPPPPNPLPPTTNINYSSHAVATFTPASCPCGNISLSGGSTLHLTAGTYAINSLSLSGNSLVVIDSGPVILNVAGRTSGGGWMTTPLDFSGGSTTNTTYDSSKFQIQYAGTQNITLSGNSSAAEVVYAPNAAVTLTGNGDIYGEVIGYTILQSGNGSVHYDMNLQNTGLFSVTMFASGNPMLGSFSWNKY